MTEGAATFEIRITEGGSDIRLFEIATGREIEGLLRFERISDTVEVSDAYGVTREYEIRGGVHIEGRMPNGIEWQVDVPSVDIVLTPVADAPGGLG